MQVAIPHELDNDTVRERLKAKSHTIGDQIPGGMADVETSWRNEDQMDMVVRAMGQELRGDVKLETGRVVLTMVLPPQLGFLQPIVEGALRQQGQKLLAPARPGEG